jgi:Pyruvate/2-oxoacid:ferredoxin oxidoreductase gamma subunit
VLLVRHPDGRVEHLTQAGYGRLNPQAPAGVTMITADLTRMARELGNPFYRNMIAFGCSAQVLGIPL